MVVLLLWLSLFYGSSISFPFATFSVLNSVSCNLLYANHRPLKILPSLDGRRFIAQKMVKIPICINSLKMQLLMKEKKRTCQTKHCLSSAGDLQTGERMIDGWLVPVFKLSNWFFVSAFCQTTGFWIAFQSVRSQQRGNCIIYALVYKTVTAVGLCCFKHSRSFHGNVHVFMNLTTISIIEAINLPIHATNTKIKWRFCQNKLKISTQTIHNNRYYVVGIIMSVNFTTLIFFCFIIKLKSLSTHIEKVNKDTNTPLLSECYTMKRVWLCVIKKAVTNLS